VTKRYTYDPSTFLPSRFFELSNQKDEKSLADIYESEYTSSSQKVQQTEDLGLKKQRAEIERLFEGLSGRLDALSNQHWTPKAVSSTLLYQP
jgi:U3 small nucleolar RNA-associated protein MPP10